ncbi:hypothetical protein GQ600_3235 [Phytophthora cactorum]|nr:hypothetical protein GQ600_3235 [Phytophthora cactorum]
MFVAYSMPYTLVDQSQQSPGSASSLGSCARNNSGSAFSAPCGSPTPKTARRRKMGHMPDTIII